MKTISSVIVAIGLVLLGLALGLCIKSGFDNFSNRGRVVTVRGLSEKEYEANKVTWPVVYKLVGNDLQSIYSEIETNNQIVTNFLNANGIAASEYTINAPDVTDKQADGYNNGSPYRFTVTSVITVTSEQVEKVRSLIQRQGELLKKGVAVIASDWNYRTIYEYTDLNEIKPEMIAEATKNAREAAEKFADDSGSKVGKIVSASQGQFSIDDRDPYTPYIKKIRVVTSLTYAIED